jgi:hypothetical protein
MTHYADRRLEVRREASMSPFVTAGSDASLDFMDSFSARRVRTLGTRSRNDMREVPVARQEVVAG